MQTTKWKLARRWVLPTLMVVGLAGCAGINGPHKPTLREKARKLTQGMTEYQVKQLLGDPYTTQMGTCGQQTARSWECLTWAYQTGWSENGTLDVVFQQAQRSWYVNSWSWY